MFFAFIVMGWLLSIIICAIFSVEEANNVDQYCMALAMVAYAIQIIWQRNRVHKSDV